MSKNPSYKETMVESGKVTPTTFAQDPTFPSPDFVQFLQKYNYLCEVLDLDIDPLTFAEQIKSKKGKLFEQFQKITEAEIAAHEKQLLAESKHIADLKEIV
jgi:hypothetical protein